MKIINCVIAHDVDIMQGRGWWVMENNDCSGYSDASDFWVIRNNYSSLEGLLNSGSFERKKLLVLIGDALYVVTRVNGELVTTPV
jgi:hypothetical protein